MAAAGPGRPGFPGDEVEEPRDAEAAGGAARQDDGLEGVEDDTHAKEQAGDQGGYAHGPFLAGRLGSGACDVDHPR